MTMFLEAAARSADELSDLTGAHMRVILDDLEHIKRSARGRFEVQPARCLSCGFTFRGRDRLSKPSKCPECRDSHILGPWFAIDPDR